MVLKIVIIIAIGLIIGLLQLRENMPNLRNNMWENMAKEAGIDDVKFFRFLYDNFGKVTTCDNLMELNSSFFMLKIDNLIKDKVLKKEDDFLIAPPEMVADIVTKAGFSMPKKAVSFCVMSPNGKPKYSELYYNSVLTNEYEHTELFKIPTHPDIEKNMFYNKTGQ